ncbi:angiopoietin-related protein 1-like [Mya arenaria]|uniref:angiopoietin-related protein 1-like n=1 Tax=Mya arenaria TaxID=6604 RepID=UPI0022E5B76B|nr:angiopoietin-related protein 1-like [Mya arenaria]
MFGGGMFGICLLLGSGYLVSANNGIVTSSQCYYDVKMVSPFSETFNITSSSRRPSVLSCSSWCCLSNADSFVYFKGNASCECNEGNSAGFAIDSSKSSGVIYGQVTPRNEISEEGGTTRQDCLEFYEDGFQTNGVYRITPPGGAAVDVWCDMVDGGWTVILKRLDGSEDFYRDWDDYASGFGYRTVELQASIGLESIHLLTVQDSSLKVYAETFGDVTPASMHAVYDSVEIQDVSNLYRLKLSGFTGDCGDSMAMHNNMPFSTLDQDNDPFATNCAVAYTGAWWKDCPVCKQIM